MKKCKICNEEIDEKAKKCPHCGSNQSWFKRWIVVGKHILETLTFITAVIVVIIMYIQIKQVNKQLEYTSEQLQIDHEFVNAIIKFTSIQDERLKKEWDELIQEYEPKIIINPIASNDMVLVNESLEVFINIRNTGIKDAEDVMVRYKWRFGPGYEYDGKDSAYYQTVPKENPKVKNIFFTSINKHPAILSVKVKYTWRYYTEPKEISKYFSLWFKDNQYRSSVVSESEFEEKWKKAQAKYN